MVLSVPEISGAIAMQLHPPDVLVQVGIYQVYHVDINKSPRS